jgi:adenosylcobinamide kinase/adenosylcobinamide-phosphate guanylyltransferase
MVGSLAEMETQRCGEGWRRALVLGGARSGKSARAEAMACETELNKIYIATAEAWDEEMRDRIAEHRARRGSGWRTVEAPRDLTAALAAHDDHDNVIVVDCLTLWLTNLMLADAPIEEAETALVKGIADSRARLVFVTNEIGLGVVPDNALARRFRDAQGRLNQRVAAAVDTVLFMAAGLQMRLKP